MNLFDILKLVVNGGIGGTILVGIYLFFQQWNAINKFLMDMRDGFAKDLASSSEKFMTTLTKHQETASADLKDARATFAIELREVTQTMMAKHDAMQERVDTIHEASIKAHAETATAINGLKTAVEALNEKVK